MNVHDPPVPLGWQIEQTQPTAEADQIDVGRINLFEHVPAEIGKIGMLFAIDLVYLDSDNKVIHLVEHLGPFRISPIRIGCAGILELESRTIFSSNTRVGDELIICTPEEMNKHCELSRTQSALAAHGS